MKVELADFISHIGCKSCKEAYWGWPHATGKMSFACKNCATTVWYWAFFSAWHGLLETLKIRVIVEAAKETKILADDATRDLEKAMPALDAAVDALEKLDKKSIAEAGLGKHWEIPLLWAGFKGPRVFYEKTSCLSFWWGIHVNAQYLLDISNMEKSQRYTLQKPLHPILGGWSIWPVPIMPIPRWKLMQSHQRR